MSRIIKILLTTLLLGKLGLASGVSNNHQLSSPISDSKEDGGSSTSTSSSSSSISSSSRANIQSSRSSSSSNPSLSQQQGEVRGSAAAATSSRSQFQGWQQHVAMATSSSPTSQQWPSVEGRLIDNKLRDKLLSFASSSISISGSGSETSPRNRRSAARRRESAISGEDKTNNFYDNRISDEEPMVVPAITEEVLPVSNLTEERMREERELLDHLNREHFPDGVILLTEPVEDLEEPSSLPALRPKKKKRKQSAHEATEDDTNAASSGGKKGGRRKKGAHKKKKIKRIKPNSGSILQLEEESRTQQQQPSSSEDQINSSQTGGSVTELSLNESDRRRRPSGWNPEVSGSKQNNNRKKPAQKRRKQSFRSTRKPMTITETGDGGNWDRKDSPPPSPGLGLGSSTVTKPGLIVLNSDDNIYDQNMQIQPVAAALKSDDDEDAASDGSWRKKATNNGKKLTPEERETRKRQLREQKRRKQLKKFDRGDVLFVPAIPEEEVAIVDTGTGASASAESREEDARRTEGGSAVTVASTSTGDGKRMVETVTLQRIIITGDLSCMKDNFIPAPAIANADIKYLRQFVYMEIWKKYINECAEYGEDLCEYGCSNTIGSFICKCPKGLRTTDNNKCMDINECLLRNGHGPCQDTCINTWSGYRCSCSGLPGTRLGEDGHSCKDIDECTVNNGGCSHTCLNTLGRAFCVCPEGFMLDDDWKTCVDIDECSNQKSIRQEFRCRGPCINTIGSFRCLEEMVGDEDSRAAGQLSKQSADGLLLTAASDSSSADDDDDENDGVDTLCPVGYQFNTTMGDCQDTNECNLANGGCQHHCINADGSFYCSCKYGFKLDNDRRNCLALNDSLHLSDVACPPLFPPRHGYLECSRPLDEIVDGPDGGRMKIINRPGSQCLLKCPTGYRLEGKFAKICGTSGEWIGDESGTCIRYPQPRLTCPTSVNVELHPNETSQTAVKLRRPKTDVSWDRDIVAEPFWAKRDLLQLPLGETNISYTAKHPVSKLTASCSFTVHVMAGNPPTVDFCPDTQIYTIEGRHQSVKATWEEPIFSDNVGVVTITKSNSPGTDFGAGSHLITYEAHDEAEWSARCTFKIVVNVSKRKDVQHFQLPILYNRFYF
ncbi:uncharacterized protein LOC129758780 [Uranotaenia lowii]|uniref:uncharacterized protein LOC129758780 n=1 Tax=Uranotaenia lowii TaxID=190385 RepID=UPI00247A6FED|nr:uncharacterized protein LOC129758780 [Uranotaenia lowii]